VRPIAVGGMFVAHVIRCSACGQPRPRHEAGGLGLRKSGSQAESTLRTQRDLNAKFVFAGLGVTFLCMIALYFYFAGTLPGALVAAVVMIILGFFFAAVSGNLVGMIGSSTTRYRASRYRP